MRRPALCLLAVVVVALAFTPGHADSVVLFKDGRYLKVTSYEMAEGWVRLDVVRGSVMLLPLERVQRIESEDRIVYESETKVVRVTVDPRLAKAAEKRRLWKRMARRSRLAGQRAQPVLAALH